MRDMEEPIKVIYNDVIKAIERDAKIEAVEDAGVIHWELRGV